MRAFKSCWEVGNEDEDEDEDEDEEGEEDEEEEGEEEDEEDEDEDDDGGGGRRDRFASRDAFGVFMYDAEEAESRYCGIGSFIGFF
jgi:hypothetical protein